MAVELRHVGNFALSLASLPPSYLLLGEQETHIENHQLIIIKALIIMV
jgi:hypothetical protein